MNNRRKRLFANGIHLEIFLLISFASLVPMLITGVSLFYLIFNVTAQQVGFPEAIAATIFPAARKVLMIVCVITPIVIIGILIFAHKATHRIVGPYDRILRELGECLAGTRQGPIVLRKKDKFQPLVDKINLLLERVK